MNKTYDSIITNVLCGLFDLNKFVKKHEPSKVKQVKEIVEKLEILDYYMTWGEEKTP